jgi:hypothetical protein
MSARCSNPCKLLKMLPFSPTQPRRANALLFPGKAAGEKKPEAYPLGYDEDLFEQRMTLHRLLKILR